MVDDRNLEHEASGPISDHAEAAAEAGQTHFGEPHTAGMSGRLN
jgi:hypothetical protein